MKDNKKILYVVIAIAILAVSIIGSTYAYWTATTTSTENSVNTESKKFSLSMELTPLYINNHIIPMDDVDATKAIINECKDNKGSGACYAYTIVLSDYDENQTAVSGKLDITTINITNLSYMLLHQKDTTETETENETCLTIEEENYCIVQDVTAIGEGTNLPLGGEISTEGKPSVKLILVIWLTNLNESQNDYDIGEFNGTVTFSLGNGGQIQGTIASSISTQPEETT